MGSTTIASSPKLAKTTSMSFLMLDASSPIWNILRIIWVISKTALWNMFLKTRDHLLQFRDQKPNMYLSNSWTAITTSQVWISWSRLRISSLMEMEQLCQDVDILEKMALKSLSQMMISKHSWKDYGKLKMLRLESRLHTQLVWAPETP